MNTIRLCPGCGAPLNTDAPGGLCPQCLLRTQIIGEEELAALPTARAMPIPGELFGDYRILKLLGHGGMGEVYEAEHTTTGRRVALKVMRHTLASEQDRKRFLREGRLAASVNHPNVVYIHGSEEICGAPAIAMELVHGGTLKDRLKREGPLPVADAVEGGLQIIDGLEAAHAAGVLHRDIKPANCFVAADGAVKVGDFGLSVSTLARGESLITASGSVMGTPAYASPEQLRGEELDVTSDIYSVGATLYHLLTGKTPFNATDFVKLITEVLDKIPAVPKSLRAEIPAELSKVLLRCLAKERKARFQSYAELRDALLPFRASKVVPAKPAVRFLAGLVDDLFAFGPSLAFLAYWSVDPLDKLAHDRTLHAALVWFPFFAFYVLYYAVSEGRWGAGVGKTLCGLRVVGRDGQAAGMPRAALRVLVYMAPFTLPPFVLMAFVSNDVLHLTTQHAATLITDWAWVPLTALLYITMRARNGYAALHDLASRTRVIVRPKTQPRPALQLTARAEEINNAAQRIGPYDVTASLWKTAGEELSLAIDPALRRKVWIHFVSPQRAPGISPGQDVIDQKGACMSEVPDLAGCRGHVTDARRDLSRATRLRWINSGELDGRSWNAYEAFEGAPFLHVAQTIQPWNAVRFWLLDLAEECARAVESPATAPALALERLWITTSGRAVLLEFPAPGLVSTTKHPATPALHAKAVQQFLTEVSRVALEGANNAPARASIRALVPLHARSFLASLTRGAFDEARFIVGNLQSLIEKPAEVTRVRRAASLIFIPGVALAWAVLIVATLNFQRTRWERAWTAAYPGEPSLRIAAEIFRDEAEAVKEGDADAKDLELTGTYIANHFASIITNESIWITQPNLQLEADSMSALRKAVKNYSTSDAGTVAKAERQMTRRIAKRERAQRFGFVWIGAGVVMATVVCAALIDFIGALGFRVLPVIRLFGFAAVNRAGDRASRVRLLARSALIWIPSVTVAIVSTKIIQSITNGDAGAAIPVQLAIVFGLNLLVDAVLVYALLHPSAGLPDRVAGTRLVPL